LRKGEGQDWLHGGREAYRSAACGCGRAKRAGTCG
jgi:hypothetical protein